MVKGLVIKLQAYVSALMLSLMPLPIVPHVQLIIISTLLACVCTDIALYFGINIETDCSREATCHGSGHCDAYGICVCDSELLNSTDNCGECIEDYYNFPECQCKLKKLL